MAIKILGGIVALSLVIAFVTPVLFKIKDVSLLAVIVIGILMMLIDLLQSLKSKDD